MEPIYEIIKNKFRDQNTVVDKINEAANKATTIYLATDPDREGEAIA